MQLHPNTLLASRYLLIKPLGQGGFAEVWLAHDTHLDNLEVALKVFAAEKGLDDSGLGLFKKEFLTTRELYNPHLLVPSHFEVIEGTRVPFMVMPFCAGGSLAVKVDEGHAFSENEIIEILKQTTIGLEVLHDKDIIHRDIKPGNILIDKHGKYLLSDFGISGKMRATLTKATTRQSYLTPAYSPPERYGKNPEGTTAGDIFSLGVAIYELCSGELPWDGQGGLMVAKGAMIPSLPKQYSERLSLFIERCMANEPADRPTAREVNDWANGKEPTSQHKKRTSSSKDTMPFQKYSNATEKSKGASGKNRKPVVIVSALIIGIILAGLLWWKPWSGGIDPQVEKKFLTLKSHAELLEKEERWADAFSKYQEAYAVLADDSVNIRMATMLANMNNQAAQARADEEEAWKVAKLVNTITSYQEYLTKYAKGEFAQDADSLIKKLQDDEGQRLANDKKAEALAAEQRLNDDSPVTDIDGNTYKAVIIYENGKAKSVWMAENLNVSRFRNGDQIPEAKTWDEWKKATKNKQPAWCYYNNDPSNGRKYGKLYNWYAFSDSRGLAPKGWRIPTNKDWTALTNSLGGENVAGSALKNSTGWNQNGNGTNSSGFSALPGGIRSSLSEKDDFDHLGSSGRWWSFTRDEVNGLPYERELHWKYHKVFMDYTTESFGYSVRCMRK